jgi:P-type Ca2+ transporter type 2C
VLPGGAPHGQPAADVIATLRTDIRRGLSDAEVVSRRERHGANELGAEKATPGWMRFLAQFRDTLVILLLIAVGISSGLWAYERESALPYEATAILAVVLLNATLGYVQQARARAAVAALRAMSAAEAQVIRDGERRRIPARELVPGDIMLIEAGDTIPADGRLLDSTALQTTEAALTGESLPVSKHTDVVGEDVVLGDRLNMIFSGTAATYGHGTAVVTATGMRTEAGRIAGLLKETEDEATPLQRELDRTGKLVGGVVVVIGIVMVATILIVHEVRGVSAILDVLILGVALAVAAVPEGLPAIVTAVLAIGVQRMARRKAIIRHLAAVETLGSASVIASDKTGTLTKNEMTVRVVATASGRVTFGGSGYAPEGRVGREGGGPIDGALALELERALCVSDRANNAVVDMRDGRWTVHGDPTEGALVVAARKAGLSAKALDVRFPRVGEIPFSSERKLMSTLHRATEEEGGGIVFSKGAPDVLLTRCSHELSGREARALTPERRAEILKVNEALASEALRTLGCAFRRLSHDAFVLQLDGADESLEEDLVFVGLIGMIDPPRAEAREAVARARRAGIRPLVITGDHPRTAAVIARELGITDDCTTITGAELEKMGTEERSDTVARVSVYARVDPEHKLWIVDALREKGAVVAMTGDGVNDAPALKKADIGVAMGIAGTEVSKEAADMVLADDNFATLVAAVEEGRAIFTNIRKFLRYLLSSNFGEVLTMFFGVLLGKQLGLHTEPGAVVLPLLATQILWINLVTDGPPALALGVDPAARDSMRRPPRPAGEGVLTPQMWRGIVFVGVIMAAGTLFVLDISLPGGFVEGSGSVRHAQTMAFTTLMLFQVVNVVNARSDEVSAFVGLFTNRWLWTAIAVSIALQVSVVHMPVLQQAFGTEALGAADWLRCLAVASSVLWLREIGKLFARRTADESRHASSRRAGWARARRAFPSRG